MNKSLSVKQLILASLLVALGVIQTKEPSRVGQQTRLVLDLSGPGATTPKVLFGKTKAPTDEPRFKNWVTALGQKQQFIVGQELKTRYFQDSSFINMSYDINQIWIQTTFNAENIISAQAHMHGLYPPSTNINTLTDWQQKNAVPPLDNVLNDQWTQWQQELGNLALINGFNTFPINVMGAEDDIILNLGEDNCPTFKKAINDNQNTLTNNIQTNFKDFITNKLNVWSGLTLDGTSALQFCQYVKWADLHNVAMTFDHTADDITQCDNMNNMMYQFYIDTDTKQNFIASNTMLKQIHDQIKSLLGQIPYKETYFYKQATLKSEGAVLADEKYRNNADEKPSYFVMTAKDINVRLIMSGLMGKVKADSSNSLLLQATSHPASLLVVELTTDKTGKLVVEAQFNDADIQLGGCTVTGPCDAATFLTFLEQQIALVPDVLKACALPTTPAEILQ